MCGDAPSPDPLIGKAAQMNAEVAREALAFYKDIYARDLSPMQKENQDLSRELIKTATESQKKQTEFADDQNEYYKETFRPAEKQMVKDAMEYDSGANIDKRAGMAAANVNQQFSNAAGQQSRLMGRYGLSSAGAFKNMARSQALATVGAQNGAAFDTMDKGIALRAGAANFGRNMPNTAAGYYGLSNQSGGQAMGMSSQAMQNASAAAGVMGQGFNTAIQGNQSAANIGLGQYNAQMQGYQADQASMTGLASAGMTAGVLL